MTVVKVGGSLFDMPDLAAALLAFCDDGPFLLVPGGGKAADAVRDWQRVHRFNDQTAHWLALRTLTVTAALLKVRLFAPVVAHPTEEPVRHVEGPPNRIRVLDAYQFCFDEDILPHTWAVTSDSIAARAAVVAGADKLVLLKSIDIPPGTPWPVAAANGWVDDHFPTVAAELACPIEVLNFRAWWANIPDEE
jgi:5-(aminomethyl)-3-furanmethanol phosphate kinase